MTEAAASSATAKSWNVGNPRRSGKRSAMVVAIVRIVGAAAPWRPPDASIM